MDITSAAAVTTRPVRAMYCWGSFSSPAIPATIGPAVPPPAHQCGPFRLGTGPRRRDRRDVWGARELVDDLAADRATGPAAVSVRIRDDDHQLRVAGVELVGQELGRSGRFRGGIREAAGAQRLCHRYAEDACRDRHRRRDGEHTPWRGDRHDGDPLQYGVLPERSIHDDPFHGALCQHPMT
jgi:hypothetical protein